MFRKLIISILGVIVVFRIVYCESREQVKPGIDVLITERTDLIMGKRVGLITNPTGVTASLSSDVDVLSKMPGVQLTALFGPEHGVRGDVTAGEKVENMVDGKTGIPMFSLYGKTRKPTDEMLANVDVLMYDIQDIGSRAYTYIYTMALSMQVAAEKGIPFIVLDRPNPLGGLLVEGPVLEPEFSSFIGLYPIPYIYGMTVGELAKLFNTEFGINANLIVVPMKNWKRQMIFEDTGLEWIPTSPHIPHPLTSQFCAATGILGELHSVNIGVGYTSPFELIGAPWIDGDELAEELNGRNLPGVYFRPTYYRPYYFTFIGKQLAGVQIHIIDKRAFLPMRTQMHIMEALLKLYPENNFFDDPRINSFDRAMGTDSVRKKLIEGWKADDIIKSWQKELEEFRKLREKYLIYR